MDKFKGKVAIVTGSSSGIGRAVALELAKEGARLVVTDINIDANRFGYEESIELPTIELLNRNGCEAVFFKCDVSKYGEVVELINNAVKKFGRLDIVCNNAGICRSPETLFAKEAFNITKVTVLICDFCVYYLFFPIQPYYFSQNIYNSFHGLNRDIFVLSVEIVSACAQVGAGKSHVGKPCSVSAASDWNYDGLYSQIAHCFFGSLNNVHVRQNHFLHVEIRIRDTYLHGS